MPSRWGLALFVAIFVLSAAPPAHAQEEPLQASNGAALYLGSLEGVLLVGAPFALGIALSNDADLGEALLCAVLLPLCALFVPDLAQDVGTAIGVVLLGSAVVLALPPTIAGVGGAEGWDADGSLVLTTGVHGLLEGALLGGAVDLAAGGEGGLGTVLGGLLVSAGATTYAALRHTELTHDPRTGVEANFLLWTPPVLMLLAGIVGLGAELPPEVALFIAGLLGLAAQATCIGLAEAALSGPPPVMMAPMMLDGLGP
jgi:hypothetical protein